MYKMIRFRIFILFFLTTQFLFTNLIAQNTDYIGEKKHYFGTAYYPESWPVESIDEDIVRMKELNMNVMRMAEFSWSMMEPTEGNYEFDWLHHVVEKLHEGGIDVILGTPTATPPAWLAEKHPEIFRVDDTGLQKTHGARRNTSYSSEIYREYSEKIVLKMAEEFGDKPGVIGWQTDNEFSFTPDYSEETRGKWYLWLKEKYKNIDYLNDLWATQLWSQQYNSFDQIPMPRDYIWHNPSLQLAWYHFTNDMIVEFQQIQVDAIRKFSSLPVTHDGMPGQRMDYSRLFENLDFMAVNNYHGWQAYNRIQSNYDRMRGYGKGFHWLFETAPNYSGGGSEGNTWFIHQPDGSMRAALWMNFALGAQGSMYWLWRQHRAGHEMPHGSVISAWNKPAANYDDIKQLGSELKQTSDFLMNAQVPEAKTALFYCHTNAHMLEVENYANGIRYYTDWTYRFYRPVADAFIHRDVILPEADLSSYNLIFAPIMPLIDEQLRENLKEWVEEGGIFVMGPMSGYRSNEWASFTNYATGDFEPWMDIFVESRIPVGTNRREDELPLWLDFDETLQTEREEAMLWSEAISSDNGKVLATYQNGMHKNLPAIIENKIGKGKVVYLGTDPGYDAYKQIALKYAKEAGIEPLATGDKDVVVSPRGEKSEGTVVVNLTNMERNLTLTGKSGTDLITGEKLINTSLRLKPFDVKVIRWDK